MLPVKPDFCDLNQVIEKNDTKLISFTLVLFGNIIFLYELQEVIP